MKKLLLLGICMLTMFSCKTPDYESAIADWVQTDQDGTWTDLQFELIEVLEEKDITVSDSLQVFQDKIDELTTFIDKAEKARSMLFFQSYVRNKEKLKSVEALKKRYENRDTAEVLGKLLKCKYAIVPPALKVRQEKTDEFLLSPDMRKCLGRLRVSK